MENSAPQEFKTKNRPKIFLFVFAAILLLSLAGNGWLIYKNKTDGSLSDIVQSSLIKPVLAEEIYIFSNDPIDSEKKATIELNQVD